MEQSRTGLEPPRTEKKRGDLESEKEGWHSDHGDNENPNV